MWTRQHRKRNTGALIMPVLATVFLSYFGFHAYNGAFGLNASYQLEEEQARRLAELQSLRAERALLESRLLLLQDGTLEKDMLDEQARRALNLTQPDEMTVMLPRSRD